MILIYSSVLLPCATQLRQLVEAAAEVSTHICRICPSFEYSMPTLTHSTPIDPHFETFNKQTFSYHGECDLVVYHSSNFADGSGLHVHIRTTRVDSATVNYSYISAAAVKIADHVLEAKDDGSLLINGVSITSSSFAKDAKIDKKSRATFAGFDLIKSIKGKNKKIVVYDLILAAGAHDDKYEKSIQIRINLKTGMLFVDMNGTFDDDSVGLMGRAGTPTGFAMARDGATNLAGEWNTYGEEWQVLNTEPKLFQESRAPQHPAGCSYDAQPQSAATKNRLRRRRRLMDGSVGDEVSKEVAMKACEQHTGRKREFCVSDVMATGDIDLAEDPFYG